MRRIDAPIEGLDVSVCRIPTASPESDGTFEWESTTLVVVEATAGGCRGLGYTYASSAAAVAILETLTPVVVGGDAMDVNASWSVMRRSIRNLGRPGVVSCAMAAVDVALWDLKARLLELPLATLLGAMRTRVPVYGSGGFTSYSIPELREQLGDWAARGMRMVKMKVGRDPKNDRDRVRAARSAVGADCGLFVDANGAYARKQALALAESFADEGVVWFEEPVSSDDLEGLRLLRDRAPSGMEIAAGEYGYDLVYFRRMLEAEAVDVLQADATRCAGITELLRVSALCEARSLPLSSHTAASLHLHPCCALPPVIHLEYFHDHARIEEMLFDGARPPVDGELVADLSRPGMGLDFKRKDAERFAL